MPATFANSELNALLDLVELSASGIVLAYGNRNVGDPIPGWTDGGIAKTQKDMEAAFLANTLDLEFSNAMGPPIFQLRGASRSPVVVSNYFSDLFSRLGQVVQGMAVAANVVNIDQYLTHYNTGAGGTNQVLQSPYVRFVMESLAMSPSLGNYLYVAYSPGNHVGSQTGGAFTAGTRTVDTAKYVGGRPRLKLVTHSTDNGVVTVTGECWNPATKAVETGKTWVTTGGGFTVALEERDLVPGGGSPAPANALMTRATAMSGVNAGNRFDARLYPPVGRFMTEWPV